jgi:hypothetical protein
MGSFENENYTSPRIVFDLTIHRENFYRVDAYTRMQPFVTTIIIVKNKVECNSNHIQGYYK